MKKYLVTIAAAAAVLLTATPASARPVADPDVHCAPGTEFTVFDVRTGKLVTNCSAKPRHPLIHVKQAFKLFDPSTW